MVQWQEFTCRVGAIQKQFQPLHLVAQKDKNENCHRIAWSFCELSICTNMQVFFFILAVMDLMPVASFLSFVVMSTRWSISEEDGRHPPKRGGKEKPSIV